MKTILYTITMVISISLFCGCTQSFELEIQGATHSGNNNNNNNNNDDETPSTNNNLKEHEWSIAGDFNNWDPMKDFLQPDANSNWAIAKGIAIKHGDEFRFTADGMWELDYGADWQVEAEVIYPTYNAHRGNMTFVGETGVYDVYFSLIDASFYITNKS